MDNFSFYSPTYFSFGQGSLSGLGALVQRFGGHKVLVHYGGGSAERSGVLGQVRAALQAAGVPFTELGGVRPNPRSGLVYQGIELCRAFGADLVLAVGGGSVIDSAKAIALGAVYDGDFWDLYALGATVQNALPVGAVLTIAAAGSEGSPVSVITQEKGMYKRGGRGEALRPKFAVMDPTFTYSLPAYQTACGATDILAHICERYFTPTTGAEVTDRLCEALLQTVIHQAPRALEQPDDYERAPT